jgi:hypothetical protein
MANDKAEIVCVLGHGYMLSRVGTLGENTVVCAEKHSGKEWGWWLLGYACIRCVLDVRWEECWQ